MRKKRTAVATTRIRSLADLETDGMFWELLLGPRSCGGNGCDRAGHYIPQRLGVQVDDPESPVGKAYVPARAAGHRVEPLALCSEWATPEERREAYWACRDELLEGDRAGDRPWAFWAIEVGVHPPGNEPSWLVEHDMLTPAEAGQILSWSDMAEASVIPPESSASTNRYGPAAAIIRRRRAAVREGVT